MDGHAESHSGPSLKIRNLQIKRGELTFLVGKVASGKSFLISSILNETEKYALKPKSGWSTAGELPPKIQINGRLGVVTQNHWLQNTTIRENILFGSEFVEDTYLKCIEMCQLTQDLLGFPDKDLEVIGPNGNRLSGGQRQRICLARAVYQNCDIYLFDDIFSSIDRHVARKIFDELILQHLVKQGKTVVCATSQYKFLQQVPNNFQCNFVLLEEGQIKVDKQFVEQYLSQDTQREQQGMGKSRPKRLSNDNALLDVNSDNHSESSSEVESVIGKKVPAQGTSSTTQTYSSTRHHFNISTILLYFKMMKYPFFICLVLLTIGMQLLKNTVGKSPPPPPSSLPPRKYSRPALAQVSAAFSWLAWS